MQWESDLIGYDAGSSYGSPSYYAQVLFGKYLGDSVPETAVQNTPPRFFYSATTDAAKGKMYLKMVNGSSVPQPMTLKLNGAAKIAAGAVMETLSGKDPAETNTISDPKHLVPVKSTLKESSASFNHTMSAYSIQVVEFSFQKMP